MRITVMQIRRSVMHWLAASAVSLPTYALALELPTV